MGLALEVTVGTALNPSTTLTAVTMNSGDSNRVRYFNPNTKAWLLELYREGATAGAAQVFSAVMHDAVRGIRYPTSETPSSFPLPYEVGQPMQPGDTLTINVSGGGAETDAVALLIYYQDVPGVAARLFSPGDIKPHIEHVKVLEVDVTTTALGLWLDTVITTTEDLLKADRQYAVLGYLTDTACLAVGVKGAETGNIRICGPGLTTAAFTAHYFYDLSAKWGMPAIPVISANNKGSIFLSNAKVAGATAVKQSLVLGLLDKQFTG